MKELKELIEQIAQWPPYFRWAGAALFISVPTLGCLFLADTLSMWWLGVTGVWLAVSISFCLGINDTRDKNRYK